VTANLEKRLRKSLGNEALEKRITELEARVAALEQVKKEPKKRARPKTYGTE
jgi:BMFP domain-containing protein YqiC